MYKRRIPAPQAEESSPMSHFSHQGSTGAVRQDGQNSTFGRFHPSSLRRCGNRIASNKFVRRYHTSGFSRHRLEKVPHYWGSQRVYWGVLWPRICTQKVKSMLGWPGLHWPLSSPWKRRIQVAPLVLVLSPPTAVGFGGIPRHVASPDRECSLTGSRGNCRA